MKPYLELCIGLRFQLPEKIFIWWLSVYGSHIYIPYLDSSYLNSNITHLQWPSSKKRMWGFVVYIACIMKNTQREVGRTLFPIYPNFGLFPGFPYRSLLLGQNSGDEQYVLDNLLQQITLHCLRTDTARDFTLAINRKPSLKIIKLNKKKSPDFKISYIT